MSPRTHKIRTTLVLTMALGAAVPAAYGRPPVDPVPQPATAPAQDVKSAHDLGRSAQDLRQTAQTSSLAGTVDPRRPVITVSSPNGFDWGDAAIGAAGGLGLTLAALGGTLVVTGRRRHPVPRQLAS